MLGAASIWEELDGDSDCADAQSFDGLRLLTGGRMCLKFAVLDEPVTILGDARGDQYLGGV